MKKKKRSGMMFKSYLKSKVKNSEIQLAFEAASMHLKIARLLEELRIKNELTQVELAKKTGVSQPMIARIERGDQDRVPTLHTINKIFNALGYEVDLVVRKVS